jgi:iron complex outermembrane receptor protein/vitamin B12 transporter
MLLLGMLLAGHAQAEPDATGMVSGTVRDVLGARLVGADVTLLRDEQSLGVRQSDARGQFAFSDLAAGRYRVVVDADGFASQSVPAFFVGAGARVVVDAALHVGLRQDVVVTAAATAESAAHVGAAVTVIDQEALDGLAKPALLEALRLVPGAQVVQVAGRGGVTSLFVRGGASNFNKVLVDGIPVNDIGGGFDYSDFATTGVERVEALREANSVLHGSDAMAGVISITTRRGQSRRPLLSAALDAGSLATRRQEITLGGVLRRLDYFAAYGHFATDNSVPNNRYASHTLVGRVGWALGSASDISATFRRVSSDYGVPNAIDFYGLADDATQAGRSTYLGLTARAQFTPAWQGVLRLASFADRSDYLNPTPTGMPFDPFGFGANYLGNEVTIVGANGTRARGRAILDYGGVYPQPFATRVERRVAAAQTTYEVLAKLALSTGVRVEHEQGSSGASTRSTTTRNNLGSFLEARLKLRRFYANAGLGYEHNDVFRSAWTPRASAALYLREPSPTAAWGDTKLVLNVGRGIKAPNLAQENSSLFALLSAAPGLTAVVTPIGPERGRSLDAGLEQGLWRGQVRLRAAYFDNRYSDLIEFLDKAALRRLGVPAPVIAATAFGAYVNASSYRARGLETALEAAPGAGLRILAAYTYLDAEVSRSFSSSALRPVENPAYPGVAIGAYGPLVGGRPFRRPVHSGNLFASYTRGPGQVTLAAYFAGRADDSTFLSDANFGNTLLLPNRNLNAGYQKLDLSSSYRLVPEHIALYAGVENLLDQRYTPAFGFPALPRTWRVGLTGTLGGDRRARP